jgi:flagellar biosynthesis chaperone FliJ
MQASTNQLGVKVEGQLQQLHAALDTQRSATKAFSAHCNNAHERCEELRRGLAALSGRTDASVQQLREQTSAAVTRWGVGATTQLPLVVLLQQRVTCSMVVGEAAVHSEAR